MKINFKKIKGKLKVAPILIADNIFYSFLILFILAIFISFFIFFSYNLIKKDDPSLYDPSLAFNEALYKEIISIWEKDQKVLRESIYKEYPNFFKREENIKEELTEEEI